MLNLDYEHLDVGRRRRSQTSLDKHLMFEENGVGSSFIGSSAYALRKFQSHVRFAMGSFTLFDAGRSQNTVDRERLERKALRHFRKSLNGGPGESVTALAVLAFFHEFGMGGLDTDFREAERLYTEAANQDCGLAQARLAFLKTHGRPNIKINHSEAEKWRNACRAQTSGSSSDGGIPSTIRWLRLAAEASVPSAQFCLALCHYNGIAVPPNDREAFRWCEMAAMQGHPGAQNVLGNLYIEGSGCPVNPTQGLRWYIRAAEKKEAAAIYNIGTLFERGLAVEEDPVQAFEWYVRASVFGSVNAQNVLGIFHEQGIGVHQNPARAVYYYRTAALSGHPHAQYNLGRCYHDGFGVQADDSLAVMWFRMGAEQGHALSLLSMAVCAEVGIGIPADRERSLSYYRRAAARDSFEARRRLGPVVAFSLLRATRALLCRPLRCNRNADKASSPSTPRTSGLSAAFSSLSLTSPTSLFGPSLLPSATSPVSPSSSNSDRFPSLFTRRLSAITYSPGQSSAPSSSIQRRASYATLTGFTASLFSTSSLSYPTTPATTPTKPTSTTTIADLPTEIILHILSYLDDLRVLSRSQFGLVLQYACDRKTLANAFPPAASKHFLPLRSHMSSSSLSLSCPPSPLDERPAESAISIVTAARAAQQRPVSAPVSPIGTAASNGLSHLFGVDAKTEMGYGNVAGPFMFLRKLGLPVFKRSCACVGACQKIKHYITNSSEMDSL
ncbi:ERAD-associated protein [Phlyctochytrium bullatum]|nr:ERAD-associated protein [Phlyctochytrium bullatum]